MKTLQELRAEQKGHLLAAKAICDAATAEEREFTNDERATVERFLKASSDLKPEIAQAERKAVDDEQRKIIADLGKGLEHSTGANGRTGGSWGKAFTEAHAGRKAVPPSGSVSLPTYLAPGIPEVPESLMELIPRTSLSGGDSFSFLQETAKTHAAAPVARGAKKPQSTYTLTRVNGTAQTIAHLSPGLDRSWLTDFAMLGGYIDGTMREGLTLATELQILDGSGVSPQLTGVWQTAGVLAQAYDTDPIKTIRQAITTLQDLNVSPSGIVMAPGDWETIELAQDTGGSYYLTVPSGGQVLPVDRAAQRIWGIKVVLSTQCPAGYAVLADWRKAMIWQREQARMEWTDGVDPSDGSSLFEKNQFIARLEARMGFGILKPSAFVIVDLSSGS